MEGILDNIDINKQLEFLNYKKDLLKIDIKLLNHFIDPCYECEKKKIDLINIPSSPLRIFIQCNKEYSKEQELVEERIKKLIVNGLLNDFSPNTICTLNGALDPRLSKLGYEFMDYLKVTIRN